jgi:hypothetical protein
VSRFAVVVVLSLSACANAPTPSSQVAASRGSGLNYEEYTCARLTAEMESLVRRELALIGAQERRIRSSSMQATVLGMGQGDGAEATELANVRGDENAVGKAREAKKCGQ